VRDHLRHLLTPTAAADNKALKRGVKEVVKALRRSPTTGPPSGSTADAIGVVIIAADISPMDVISHIPVLCEDHNIPYIYVASRAELGLASKSKRATSVIMLTKAGRAAADEKGTEGYEEAYADLLKLVQKASVGVVR
jgi:H/ACA ribonucleoprotein complex subunit 2